MDALELLKADHQRVEKLFQQIQQTEDFAELKELLGQVRTELELHTHLEETLFYPAFESYDEFQDLLEESYEDHGMIHDLLDEIDDTDDEEELTELVDELIESVQHHVEAEEDDFFAKVREVMDRTQLDQLGILLSDAKEDAQSAA